MGLGGGGGGCEKGYIRINWNCLLVFEQLATQAYMEL